MIYENTVRLWKNEAVLTYGEWKRFSPCSLITGNDVDPVELKRWSFTPDSEAEVMAEAKAELAKLFCSYHKSGQLFRITEYALEVYAEDEEGEYVSCSSSFYFAEAEYFGFPSDDEEEDDD